MTCCLCGPGLNYPPPPKVEDSNSFVVRPPAVKDYKNIEKVYDILQ